MPRLSARDHKLNAKLATHIRTRIEEGQLRPGDKLPTHLELASEFGCSLTTVREALSVLRGQGLIESRHGIGTYVRTATVEMWMEPLEAAILLGAGQIRHMLELQTAVLAGLAYTAALNADDSIKVELAHALFELECAPPYTEQAVAAELAFQDVVAQATGNPLLMNVLRVLQEACRSMMRLVAQDNRPGVEACRFLYDAILRGDAVAARQVMTTHMENMQQQIMVTKANAQPQ